MDMKKWFKEAKYGMMIHWGLYSVLGREWKNHYSEAYAEWIQATLAIPNAEYAKLANVFNPIYFNAEDWVKFAKGCGIQYMVLTSKHHDGFAMFRSKVDLLTFLMQRLLNGMWLLNLLKPATSTV